MDSARFDSLVKALASPRPRRAALSLLAVLGLGLAREEADAKKKNEKKVKVCQCFSDVVTSCSTKKKAKDKAKKLLKNFPCSYKGSCRGVSGCTAGTVPPPPSGGSSPPHRHRQGRPALMAARTARRPMSIAAVAPVLAAPSARPAPAGMTVRVPAALVAPASRAPPRSPIVRPIRVGACALAGITNRVISSAPSKTPSPAASSPPGPPVASVKVASSASRSMGERAASSASCPAVPEGGPRCAFSAET